MKKEYIYGKNAVIEAIYAEKGIEKIIVQYGSAQGTVDKIRYLAKEQNIAFTTYDTRKFNELVKFDLPNDARHQGVVALLEQVKTIEIEELIEICSKKSNPILLALDSITDPHNLGASARTAECAGAEGIIITQKNSAPINSSAIKSSAGALMHLPVCKTVSISSAVKMLKDEGFKVFAADEKTDLLYTQVDFSGPVVIIIGNEGEGIHPVLKKLADNIIKIPMKGKINSLNASVSSAVILFEILRQRGEF